MDQLLAMRVFVRIADAGSFARAADSLELPRSSVSKLLQDLEKHLGARLFERSTRTLTITPEGAVYRDHAIALLEELEAMDAAAGGMRMSPRGKLRVDIGSSLANLVILPALPGFFAQYPGIELSLGVSDRPADLIGEGVDCVIRGGNLADSSLVARCLCSLEYVTCATPAYLDAYGVPSHPDDLRTTHPVITYFFPQSGKSLPLQFSRKGEQLEIQPRSPLRVSESTAQIHALLAGLGIAQIFAFGVREHLASGRLVEVLGEWEQPSHPFHIVYPARKYPNPRTQAFAGWVAELLRD